MLDSPTLSGSSGELCPSGKMVGGNMVTHPAMTLKGHLATDNVAGSDLQLMIMEKRAK